jgi:predicted XRE-type DNA-binding protein
MEPQNESVWDALYNDPDDADDLNKRSSYLILIQARLYGLSGKIEDKAESLGLPLNQIRELMKGDVQKFHLNELC